MKSLCLSLFTTCLLVLTSVNAQSPEVPERPVTIMTFQQTEADLGSMRQSEKRKHVFTFKNTGEAPLYIQNVKGSCGCLLPSWPKEPILPGETGEIEAVFDAKNKKGKQFKRLTITANTYPAQTFLLVKADVLLPNGQSKTEGSGWPKPIPGPTTNMEFSEMERRFEYIKAGEKVETYYEFTNAGTEPLIIANIHCMYSDTRVDWPKSPLAPGEKGRLEVTFDSKNSAGVAFRTIHIQANTVQSPIVLSLFVHVSSSGGSNKDDSEKTIKPSRNWATPPGPVTKMKFEHTEFDFGSARQGEKVRHYFTFSNTGNEPLIISNAKGSCGCTVADWPKEPVLPGEYGTFEVVFDTTGKRGKQSKRITITANTDPVQTFLTFRGEVIVPEKGAVESRDDEANESANTQWENANCVSVYPNPTTEFLKLDIKDHYGKTALIEIFSDMGQILEHQVIERISTEPITFDVRGYTPGMYLAVIRVDGEKPLTKCFLVMKK